MGVKTSRIQTHVDSSSYLINSFLISLKLSHIVLTHGALIIFHEASPPPSGHSWYLFYLDNLMDIQTVLLIQMITNYS